MINEFIRKRNVLSFVWYKKKAAAAAGAAPSLKQIKILEKVLPKKVM